MTWNFNLTDAPRGRTEIRTRTIKGKNGEPDRTADYSEFVPDEIWVATKCGKVFVTHWLDGAGRWNRLATGEDPIATIHNA